jgi:hypothetical protein
LHTYGNSRHLYDNGNLDVSSLQNEVAVLQRELQDKNKQLEGERQELAKREALIKYAAGMPEVQWLCDVKALPYMQNL